MMLRILLFGLGPATGLLLSCAVAAQEVPHPRGIVAIPQAAVPAGSKIAGPQLPSGTPSGIVGADPAAPVTDFVDALQRAYWTNPGLLAERSRLRSSDFRLPEARAGYGPRVDYELGYGRQQDRFSQALGGYTLSSGSTETATAVFTQPLLGFGRTAAAEDVARAQIEFQRSSVEFNEEDTLLKAISAYIAVIRDRGGVAISSDNLALLTRELRDNRSRLNAREVTITDVQQVETRVEQGRAQLLSGLNQTASSEADFLKVVGAPAGELKAPNPLAMPVRTLEDAYAAAEQASPMVSAAYAREKISRAQLSQARAELLPRIDLRGNTDYGLTAPYLGSRRQVEFRAAVQISGTLIDSGQRDSRIGEARASNDADWRLIDGAVRDAKSETSMAWNEWLSERAALDRLSSSIQSAEAAYNGALLQEKAGLRTTLDVLDLARELLNVRSAYNAASANSYVAEARLLKAIGMLNLVYLIPDAPRYDRDEHFRKVRLRGDVPLLTPIFRAADRLFSTDAGNRPTRDPAAKLGTRPVEIPNFDAQRPNGPTGTDGP